MKAPLKILVLDDDASMVGLIREALQEWGYEVAPCSHPREALDRMRNGRFDLALSDMMMPEMSGLEFLREARRIDPRLDVVIMTGFGNIEGAVKAIQSGATDYLTKPFPLAYLREKIAKVLNRHKMQDPEFASHSSPQAEEWTLVTQDPAMSRILRTIENVARTSATILIEGETGTGKELLSRYLHLCSDRKNKKFIAINCAAIPKDLLESELFGHERGAFTGAGEKRSGKFEAAHEGTLLLDEVGEMSGELQAKLLRVLQEKEFYRLGGTELVKADVRVIGATNRNLKESVRQGRFREDLYYRLNVLPIYVPPLRERKGDIPLLANLLLKKYEREHQLKEISIEPSALSKLEGYVWPGNIRELDNVLLRAALTAPNGVIGDADILLDEDPRSDGVDVFSEPAGSLADLEKQKILQTLKTCNGNRTHAAKALGISLRTLRNKIRQYRDEGARI